MMQTAVKTLLIVGVHFLAVQSALSQGLDLQNYVTTQFGLEEGLPQSTVNDIIQTRDGYIWLATFGGLVRFDGHSFTTFNRSNTPGMESDRLLKIFGALDGSIWLFPENTETVVFRFKDGKCTKFSFGDKIAASLRIYEDKKGQVWFTALENVYRYTGDELVKVPISENPDLIEKAKRDSEGIWMGEENRVLKTTDDSVVQMYDSIMEKSSTIIDLIEHPKDSTKLLVGTSMDGIIEIEINNDEKPITNYMLPYDYFLGFRTDEANNIFGHTAQGIVFWEDENFKVFNPFTAQNDIRLKVILQDNEGNYWIGTEGDGLFKLRKSVISMIDKEDGLENEKMLSLTKLEDGTMLFSTNCGGVFEWKNGRATLSSVQSFYKSACNWSVFQDSRKRIWIGGGKPYMTNSLDEMGVEFGEEEGYTGFSVFATTEDSKGNIWIATANGIYVYDGYFSQTYTSNDGLYYNHASVLYEDEKEVMWVGTKAGLNTIQNGEVSKIELMESSSPDSSEVKQPWVRSIYKDEDGGMWFGTYGNGLFSLKNGVITNITTQAGLFDNIVSHIVEGENGNFWMGSNRGISRVNKKELYEFIEGEIEKVNSYSYGKADGMNSAETNGGFQPSTITDSLGNIYFPTVGGVAVVSTKDIKRNKVPPPVYIENLRTNKEVLPVSESITMPYNTPYLQIQYTAINFTDPKKVEFKHRIKGLNDDWIEVGGSREVIYSSIPPGEYTFQVIASNNDGIWNEEGASLAITVIPPFWQTQWFYSLLFILFVSTGPAIYYVRVNNLKRENERQKRFTEQLIDSQENERRRIASELHDGLGQQILVIKNRAELAQKHVKNPKELASQLQEIMKSAVRSIGDVRSISHGLRPVHLEKFGLTESLTNLCDQIQGTSSIEWSYHIDDIDEIIPKEKEIHFYRVLQEGVNNVLKHSCAKEASIMVRQTANGVNGVLWDDGKGFEIKDKKLFGGLGFSGMHERIETLGGSLVIQSTIGEGTTIKILIPVQEHG